MNPGQHPWLGRSHHRLSSQQHLQHCPPPIRQNPAPVLLWLLLHAVRQRACPFRTLSEFPDHEHRLGEKLNHHRCEEAKVSVNSQDPARLSTQKHAACPVHDSLPVAVTAVRLAIGAPQELQTGHYTRQVSA